MNIQAKLVAGLFLILAVLASYFATYRYGRHVEYITQDNLRKEAIIKQEEKNLAITLAYAKKLTEAIENEQRYQAVIADAVNRAERLQVHFSPPTLPSTPISPSDKNEANRIFYERLDRGFAVLQERNTARLAECEEINKEAILVNSLNYVSKLR